LLDLIPRLSPEHKPPYHLREWCDLIERAATQPVRGLCSCPIRHYKTETTLHGIVWLLLQDPSRNIILLSHSFERAQALGKRLRQIAKTAGVGPTRGTDTIADWRNDEGGGVVIMSADQSRLGYDCGALFFDDPLDEQGWDDPAKREEVDQTITHYTARCMRRGKPGPCLGVGSRGHPDDPFGRRLARTAVTWEYVHYPAILHEGTADEKAFAEDVWSLDALRKMRAELAETDPTERLWWAQLMGSPRAAGSDLFGTPARWSETPEFLTYRTVYGCDFAFSQTSSSDWFSAVALRIYSGKAYLLEARREKLDPNLIEHTLKSMQHKYGRAPIYSYQSGPEIGLTNVLIERGVPIYRMQARYNKLVRAERTIRRWNDGNIAVPEDGRTMWLPGFLRRVSLFRGHEKDQDDEVDALVSACDGGWGGGIGSTPKTVGKPRV
jgi:predicted phage terminase large subunit-like protein